MPPYVPGFPSLAENATCTRKCKHSHTVDDQDTLKFLPTVYTGPGVTCTAKDGESFFLGRGTIGLITGWYVGHQKALFVPTSPPNNTQSVNNGDLNRCS